MIPFRAQMSNAKFIILLGDGMADFPVEALNDQTPLQAAKTPNMDRVARVGIAGMFTPIIAGLPAGSDVGNLSCFGYDPRETYTGRAPIEAASRGIPLGPMDIAFRCNLVTISEDESMQSFTAGHISSEEGAAIIETLNQRLGQYPIAFHNGVGYRHLGILTTEADTIDAFDSAVCTPPHNIAEQPIANYLPSGAQSDVLREVMTASC